MSEALAPNPPAERLSIERDSAQDNQSTQTPAVLGELITIASKVAQRGEDGLDVIYQVLGIVAARFDLEDVVVTTQIEPLGLQVFRLGRKPMAAGELEHIRKAAPFVSVPDVVAPELKQLVVGIAELAVATQVAKRYPLREPATGLPSRGVFNEALRAAAAQGSRYGWTFTILVLRVRDGKETTAEIGPLGQAFARALRSGDTGARLQGSTFMALLPNATSESPHALVRRFLEESGLHAKTIHYGSATTPNESVDPAELFRLAAARLGDAGERSPKGQREAR